MTVLDALSTSPQTKATLARRTGLTTREVEQDILAARLDHVPIVSSGAGYRLARSAAEVETCWRALRSRALTQMVTARALRTTARRLAQPVDLTLGLTA